MSVEIRTCELTLCYSFYKSRTCTKKFPKRFSWSKSLPKGSQHSFKNRELLPGSLLVLCGSTRNLPDTYPKTKLNPRNFRNDDQDLLKLVFLRFSMHYKVSNKVWRLKACRTTVKNSLLISVILTLHCQPCKYIGTSVSQKFVY